MNILREIVAHKKNEIQKLHVSADQKLPYRSFKKAIQGKKQIDLIAEIKARSPSNPQIFAGELKVDRIAKTYEKAGASAISILTDNRFFGGSPDYLTQAKKATKKSPILAKDFFISEKQIEDAKNRGADAVLLIAKILTLEELQRLLNYTQELQIDALVEIANQKDLEKVLQTNATIIGINNRNLENFSIDFKNTFQFAKKLKNKIVIAMSGLVGAEVQVFQGLIDAVLVGTKIMQASNMSKAIKAITSPRPLLKICGIRNKESAEFCEELGVDLVGLNFVSSSRRCVSLEEAIKIRNIFIQTKLVGVFQNQSARKINKLAKDLKLDFVQLHGTESPEFCRQINFPLIKAINKIEQKEINRYQDCSDLFLFDAPQAGSGEEFNHQLLKSLKINKPFLVAGGVNAHNARDILQKTSATGLDTASGVEKDGEVNLYQIYEIFKQL